MDTISTLDDFPCNYNIIANDLAHLLNISSTAVLQKINGQSDFFLSEATKIVNEYNWKYEIFLN